ncbi:uncharacterized protein LOC144866251 [Branchiostoma floridae x Branchiostoma japonicum]
MADGHSCEGNHSFEVLRTANQTYKGVDFISQEYEGIDFLVIEAKLPAHGLSATENWCRDYQNLCAEYGKRPTGCGEDWAVHGGRLSHAGRIRCVSEYNSDPYINNVLGCDPSSRVAAVENLAFSAGATSSTSFGFNGCDSCHRGIYESRYSLHSTSFGSDGTGDRTVYTVCTGSAGNHSFEVLRTANQTYKGVDFISQEYEGIDFLVIEAKLPAHGLSATENWCRDYQNLCAEYGKRPTGCGEDWADEGGRLSNEGRIRCVSEYNSDPYINNVLGCLWASRVAAVANLAFSAGATSSTSFGFNDCNRCQRGIYESRYSLHSTSFGSDGTGNRTVFTVCAGYAGNDECATGNGGCAHFCVHTQSGHRCTCQRGFILMADGHGCEGNHAFEILRTANQHFEGFNFFVIKARLPGHGLSATENWCRDYQNLCAEYGRRPTGCGEDWAVQGGSRSHAKCVTDYNSDPYINNVLGCYWMSRIHHVANLAFSAGATSSTSFGFNDCNRCQRGIYESRNALHSTSFGMDGTGDRTVYTVCTGSAGPCPTLTPPDNGVLSPMGANSHNDEVTFTCNQNYELEGAPSVKCQANGTWSDRIPTCTRETVFF